MEAVAGPPQTPSNRKILTGVDFATCHRLWLTRRLCDSPSVFKSRRLSHNQPTTTTGDIVSAQPQVPSRSQQTPVP